MGGGRERCTGCEDYKDVKPITIKIQYQALLCTGLYGYTGYTGYTGYRVPAVQYPYIP